MTEPTLKSDLKSGLGFGLGLRPPHFAEILERKPKISWFEAITENHLSGRGLRLLEKIREFYPIVLHGVSLSIGSTDPLNQKYIEKLKQLADRIQPHWISDHLCWTGVEGENLHDLLPLPYTEEVLQHLTHRISEVQEALGRRLVLENVSAYLSFEHSEMSEWEFLTELCQRADCELLLDINNVYVSSVNQNFDPLKFLNGIPVGRVRQFHLAGHSVFEGRLIDTHDAPVTDSVWKLYAHAIRRFGLLPTLLERDGNIPSLDVLECELNQAKQIAEVERGKLGAHLSP